MARTSTVVTKTLIESTWANALIADYVSQTDTTAQSVASNVTFNGDVSFTNVPTAGATFPWSYIMYIDGAGDYVAEPNPRTSLTKYSGAVYHTVLEAAQTALNTAGGGVIHHLANSTHYNLGTKLTLKEAVSLSGECLGDYSKPGAVIDITADIVGLELLGGTAGGNRISNLAFTQSHGAGYTSQFIKLVSDSSGSLREDTPVRLDHLYFYQNLFVGTYIEIENDDGIGMDCFEMDNVLMRKGNIGLDIDCDHGGAEWFNGNLIQNLKMYGTAYGIITRQRATPSTINSNTFNHIFYQGIDPGTETAITLDAGSNFWYGVNIWDIPAAKNSIAIDANSTGNTFVGGRIPGTLTGDPLATETRFIGNHHTNTLTLKGTLGTSFYPIISDVRGASWTYTNQPLAENEPNSRFRFYCDLSYAERMRIVARVLTASTSANTPILKIKYSTDDAAFSEVNAANKVHVDIDVVGTKKGDWEIIDSGGVADVILGLFGEGGDGAADPQFGYVGVQVR
jgi:hypothetical protein